MLAQRSSDWHADSNLTSGSAVAVVGIGRLRVCPNDEAFATFPTCGRAAIDYVIGTDYKATGNLRAVQIFLGHAKIDSTVRYLGVDVENALELPNERRSEQTHMRSLGLRLSLLSFGRSFISNHGRVDVAGFAIGSARLRHLWPSGRFAGECPAGQLLPGSMMPLDHVQLVQSSRHLVAADRFARCLPLSPARIVRRC